MSDNNITDNKIKSFSDRYAKKDAGPTQTQTLSEKYAKKPHMTTESLSKKDDNMNVSSSKADLVYLVKGVDDGKNAWYYVLVERLKLSLFLKALNDDVIHLENYGEILHSAYGDEPPQSITDALKKEYGIK